MLDIQQFAAADQPRIRAMEKGGALLGSIRDQLRDTATVGTTFEALEAEAQRLIKAGGAKPSFTTVANYHWATCITKNDGLCHGIPRGEVVEAGDIVTIDVGLIYDGFHTDTSITFPIGSIADTVATFLAAGKKSLVAAIRAVRPGGSVYDISHAMEMSAHAAGYGLVTELTGHGVGVHLHETPNIPCVASEADKHHKLRVGQTIAVEIMYTMGSPSLTVDSDGWTFRTRDHSLSGMFEDTVVVTKTGAAVLTKPSVTGIL